ncbi:MAG: 3-methyl-2-oxobutanoate dehydrogenase subunit VorB [Sphaerochaetaceae bacterium]|jgi:2-oxoisovalerate ferredoxin oxidoreductase alpha subunit
MDKRLLTGNEAAVLGALMGGCTHFFGYPITPASEIAEHAAYYFNLSGRTFLQAESEVSAINMVYGAASGGAKVMTASSGPGIALMGEALSYLAGSQLPAVIIDMQRSGPGLGNIWPEQSDYNMVVKGGGHGSYSNIVLAPSSVQEMFDFTKISFDLAQKYRVTVFILADGYIGQMMESITLSEDVIGNERQSWALYGDKESKGNLITSIFMSTEKQSDHNEKLQSIYRKIESEIVDYEEIETEDADVVFIAYGIVSRICHSAVTHLREEGHKVGLFRLKTLFPFPKKRIKELSESNKRIIVVEMSNGQMRDDVILASGNLEIESYLTYGGIMPKVEKLIEMAIGRNKDGSSN